MTKIVIIEDEDDIRDLVVDTLEFADYEVYSAMNGHEGVELVEQVLPDLILCDVMMPQLDGYGVLLHLSQNHTTSTIPFIFLTARAARNDLRKGMSMGADDYITKPFTAQELLEAVDIRLQKFQAMRVDDHNLERKQLRDYINLTVPHELRTPLTGIIGYMHMAKDAMQNNEGKESVIQMLDGMERATDRLSDLIDRYITYANVRAMALDPLLRDKLTEYRLPIELQEVIVHESEKQTHKGKRYSDLKLDLASGRGTILHGHMHRLVGEMVSNAVKFSANGSPVIIKTYQEGGLYWVCVTNTGRGMTEDQIANIGVNVQFDRDYYEQQGAGLGLMIIKHIVDIYNGQWKIKSTPDEQTTISVALPLV